MLKDGETADIQDACDFTVKFEETLNFEDDSEVAITEILYGPLYNIEDYNSRFSIVRGKTKQDYSIPANFYETKVDVLGAIKKEMDSVTVWSFPLIQKIPSFSYLKSATGGCSLKINDDRTNFLVDTERNQDKNVLKFLGYSADGTTNVLHAIHEALPTTIQAVKIHSNIVRESQIDNNMVGILDIAPLKRSVAGYSCLRFENPTYQRLRASQISDISIKITNMYGRKMDIQDVYYGAVGYAYVKYPTIVNVE